MTLTASQIIGKGHIPVKLKETKIEAGGTGYNAYPAYAFERKNVLILSAQKYYKNTTLIEFYANKKRLSATVPDTFEVEELPNDNADAMKLREQYQAVVMKDLSVHLHHGFTIGSDPEIFVEDENGKVIPAFDFLGSKEKPSSTADGAYGSLPMYWDGFQAEFVTSAENCLAWQVDSVQRGLLGVYKAAKKKFPNARLSAKTVMDIPEDLLKSSKDEHVQFGCMPSKNAYGLEGIKLSGREVPFRSAGGHIHFGTGVLREDDAIEVVKSLDAVIGVMCVSLFASFDDPKRRAMYGLPGEFRLPKHGLEYRVLSNAWLLHPLVMNVVFDLARKTVVFGRKGLRKYWIATEEETIETIRYCDVEKAREILQRNEKILNALAKAAYPDGVSFNHMFNMMLNGIEVAIEEPTNIVKNWDLDGRWVTHSDGHGKNWRLAKNLLAKGQKV